MPVKERRFLHLHRGEDHVRELTAELVTPEHQAAAERSHCWCSVVDMSTGEFACAVIVADAHCPWCAALAAVRSGDAAGAVKVGEVCLEVAVAPFPDWFTPDPSVAGRAMLKAEALQVQQGLEAMARRRASGDVGQ